MIILEYKLDATEYGMRAPACIDDGGYWKDGNKLIGITRDNPEFHIPTSMLRLTDAELTARQLSIHGTTPMVKEDGVEMTDAEVSTVIQDWIATKQ